MNTLDYYKAYQQVKGNPFRKQQGKTFIVFDLETTGFDGTQGCQLTQLSAARVEVQGSQLVCTSDFFTRLIKLDEHNISRLRDEVARKLPPDSDSLHFVLALNRHHTMTRNEAEYASLACEAGVLSKTEYDLLLPTLSREDRKGNWPSGAPKITRYQSPHVLTPSEFAIFWEAEQQRCDEKTAILEFIEWSNSMGTNRFIAHNGDNFDKVFFWARCTFYGITLPRMVVTDSMWLSRLLFLPAVKALGEQYTPWLAKLQTSRDPSQLSSKLQDLRVALSVEGGLAHSAEGDVVTTINVLNAMVSFMEEHEVILFTPESPTNGQFLYHMEQALVKHQSNDFRY